MEYVISYHKVSEKALGAWYVVIVSQVIGAVMSAKVEVCMHTCICFQALLMHGLFSLTQDMISHN